MNLYLDKSRTFQRCIDPDERIFRSPPSSTQQATGFSGKVRDKIQKPTISVIMPVFNAGHFIDQAIASIRQQTFKDFELIIINDASTDNSEEIIKKHAQEDNRIILTENQENLGQARSRNKALDIARGQFVAIMDADDVSLPNRLELEYEFLQNHQDVVLVGSGSELINENNRILGKKIPPIESEMINYRLLFGNPMVASTVMFRTNIIREFGGYKHEYQHAEDYYLYCLCAAKYKVANIQDILVQYRQSPSSVTIISASRQVQLNNTYSIALKYINNYQPFSIKETKSFIKAIHGLTNNPFQIVKSLVTIKKLTNAFLSKESITPTIRSKILEYCKTKRKIILASYVKSFIDLLSHHFRTLLR